VVRRQHAGHFQHRTGLQDGVRIQQQQVHSALDRLRDRTVHGSHKPQIRGIALYPARKRFGGIGQSVIQGLYQRPVLRRVDIEHRF
jgi:hypothetical protein